MAKAIFALADNPSHADRIVSALHNAGFSADDISVLISDHEGRLRDQYHLHDYSKKKGAVGHENTTKAPEGATTGAIAGGVLGGSLGLLAGIGALAIPGLGAFIAAGPLIAALSGSAVGGSLGLLVGALVGLGIPEYEAKRYEASLKNQGKVLISIHAENSTELDNAKHIFEKEHAKDISTSREKALK